MLPSASVKALPSKLTVSGASPDSGPTARLAVGGWFGGGGAATWIEAVAVAVPPPSSVTVSVTA